MAMELHEQRHNENVWLSVGRLPAASPFLSAPWEVRHCQELALRDAVSLAYEDYSSNSHDEKRQNDDSYREPTIQFLNSDIPCTQEPPFPLTSIREAELVSRCLYALQGIPVAVTGLQLLANLFSCQVADRSLHRLPSLWHRSSSTKALGKLLTTFVQAGCVRCQLEEFVHFFLNPQTQKFPIDQLYSDLKMQSQSFMKQKKRSKQKTKHQRKSIAAKDEELNFSPPYSLVNQAFAKAVKTILQGHLAALNALTNSVLHRRSTDGSQLFDSACQGEQIGAVIGLPSCDMTLLELHLHTKSLRIQLQALGSICLCNASAESFGLQEFDEPGGWLVEGDSELFDKFSASTVVDFKNFPRGADLLTFLYRRLQESDRVHVELLQYLFSCACQPYLVFVHSWLYHAKVTDPYKEFIVDEAVAMAASVSQLSRKEHSLLHSKMQASVSAPCFLENVCTPLIRSGQQLQVLLRLVETGVADATYNTTSWVSNGFRMLESALKCWSDLASENWVFSPALIFNKEKLDELIEHRQRKRDELMQNFDLLFSNLHSKSQIYKGFNVPESRQVNSQSLACNIDCTMPDGLTVQNMVRDSSCSTGKGDLEDVEELEDHKNNLMPLEMFSECLSLSKSGEKACGVHEKENKTHDYGLANSSKRGGTETEDPVSFGAEKDQPFSSERNEVSNQRKRWIEPLEAVVLHGRLEEEGSLKHKLDAEEMDLCQCMPFISDHEVEVNPLHSRLSGNYHLGISISDGVSSYGYKLPSLSQASFWSESKLESQDGSSSLKSSTLAKNKCGGGLSFFFSNICLEELGPEFFGRSYIHKLAQGYKSPSLLQSDSYKKNVIDFDSISQKFWNFEDCMCSASFDMKFLPAFSFTNAVETLSLSNRNINLTYTEDKRKLSEENVEGQLYRRNKKASSSTFPTSGLCNQTTLCSKFEPSVEFQDEMAFDRVEEDMKLEKITKNFQKKQGSDCGGASWQSYLGLKGSEEMRAGIFTETALESSEILPLEVIVDKCIIQEVLTQYQCISHFSVRLLHEVFGLQGHLAALRRYFFMERGDWADTFTAALYHHVWYPTGSQQRQLEVQTLLEVAIQNSSCQEDEYAERLHVSVETKGEHVESNADNLDHIFVNKNSLSAFDFIILGYHLEWPISLIIPSEMFKLYNAMFSFLIRVKLSVHALSDIWQFLKELLFVSKKGNGQTKQEWINILMLFRQQVSHFITTLQGHIESQLLHNVWCKFLQALHHEGKDLQILETLHGLYLKDALHVCFLSDEMQPVMRPIEDVMQALLDLSSCLNIFGKQEDGKPTLESAKVQSAILEAKRRYESCIEGLCQIALNSHNQLSLSQFWIRLDFNGFFGDIHTRNV